MKCVRCSNPAEIETERGVLCNECDCKRLSAINNTENPETEEEFWRGTK